MTGIVYRDDAQVVVQRASKSYGGRAGSTGKARAARPRGKRFFEEGLAGLEDTMAALSEPERGRHIGGWLGWFTEDWSYTNRRLIALWSYVLAVGFATATFVIVDWNKLDTATAVAVLFGTMSILFVLITSARGLISSVQTEERIERAVERLVRRLEALEQLAREQAQRTTNELLGALTRRRRWFG